MIKSPIKYFGGKGGMFNNIIKYFPEDDNIDTYIEPFGGSYSIGFAQNKYPNEIYNDLEKNVYSLYKVLSDKTLYNEFKYKCDLAIYSQDLRNEYKIKLKNDDISMVDRAFYYFYLNRTSHNGVGGLSVNTITRRNMSKSVSDFLSSIDRLEDIHQRLSKVIVLNQDGIELIKKYDRQNVFFYLDPPYEQSTRTSARYDVDMNRKSHEMLLDTLLNLQNAKFLLSGYDCDLYNILQNNKIEKIQFQVNTVDGNKKPKVKTETLWKNY